MAARGVRFDAELVDVVRDFLHAHRALRGLHERFQAGALRFDDVRELVGDGEESLLFRLKERCHASFRTGADGEGVGHEALFDLAVGALFHEAMKLREMLYQQSAYGPRVAALRARGAADADADALLQAFDALLRTGRERLAQGMVEVETLLARTLRELRAVIVAHRANGFVARFLVESPELIEAAFAAEPDAVLADLYGSAGSAWTAAARSWLRSGYFGRAARALDEAARHDGESPPLARARAFSTGMQAYLDGRYAACVEQLECWLDSGLDAADAEYGGLAYAALSRLALRGERQRENGLGVAAANLAGRLRATVEREPGAA